MINLLNQQTDILLITNNRSYRKHQFFCLKSFFLKKTVFHVIPVRIIYLKQKASYNETTYVSKLFVCVKLVNNIYFIRLHIWALEHCKFVTT